MLVGDSLSRAGTARRIERFGRTDEGAFARRVMKRCVDGVRPLFRRAMVLWIARARRRRTISRGAKWSKKQNLDPSNPPSSRRAWADRARPFSP
jgi:hypothetical protein